MANQPNRNLPAKSQEDRSQKPPSNIGAAFNANPLFMAAQHWDRLVHIANEAARSGLLPAAINTPQKALVVAMKGVEMGFSPLQAFERINVVDGKAVIDGQGMLILIMERSPNTQIEWVESTNERCTVRIKNPKQEHPVTETFTIEDGKRAGLLGKTNWQKYPKMMLRWRALAACARIAVPHVIGGAYTADEIGYETDDRGAILHSQINSATARDVTQSKTPSNLTQDGPGKPPEPPAGSSDTPIEQKANGKQPEPKTNQQLMDELFQTAEDKGYSKDEIREIIKKKFPETTKLNRVQIEQMATSVMALEARILPEIVDESFPPAPPPETDLMQYEKLPFEK